MLNINQAISLVYKSYDAMFRDDILVLSSLNKFLDIASYYGNNAVWSVYNMLLLLSQAPEYRNLMFEQELLDERVYISPGSRPVSLISLSSKTQKYEVFEMFDLSQTTASEQAKYSVVTATPHLTLYAVLASLKSIGWKTTCYSASAFKWSDWARVGDPDPHCRFAEVYFREASDDEKSQLSTDVIDTNKCRDIWKAFALWNLYYMDEIRTSNDFPHKYLPQSELFADLMCTRYKLSSGHGMEHIPKALDGVKVPLKEFRETFEPVLFLMRTMCGNMDKWVNFYVNPHEPVAVEKGGD